MNRETIYNNLTDRQFGQFRDYYGILTEWNKVMNLTAITGEEEVALKHFADSLTILPYIKKAEARTLIDVGTGAGFPGIPLKIVYPELQVTLLDSLEKRVKFLNEVIMKLGLEGIRAVHARAEDAGRAPEFREQFDVAAARAVAPMNILCEYCLPFVKVNGTFIAMKGPAAEEYAGALKILKAHIEADDSFFLANGEYSRRVICIKKDGITPAKYPRKAGTPSKNSLK